jgi:hypothetical protein
MSILLFCCQEEDGAKKLDFGLCLALAAASFAHL